MKKVFFISKEDMIPQCIEIIEEIKVVEIYDKGIKLPISNLELNEVAYLPGYLMGDMFSEGDTKLPVAMVVYKVAETNSEEEDTIQLDVIKDDIIAANAQVQSSVFKFFNQVYGAIAYGDDGILVN